jgi:hypothetical protein
MSATRGEEWMEKLGTVGLEHHCLSYTLTRGGEKGHQTKLYFVIGRNFARDYTTAWRTLEYFHF